LQESPYNTKDLKGIVHPKMKLLS